jgi:hypothetical protein
MAKLFKKVFKKDYEEIAAIIAKLNNYEEVRGNIISTGRLIRELGKYFEKDNPKFDYDKFFKACRGL